MNVRIAEDQSLASRGLPNDDHGDHEGRIFLSYPHTNYGFFSCSPLFHMHFHMMTLLDVLGKIAWVR